MPGVRAGEQRPSRPAGATTAAGARRKIRSRPAGGDDAHRSGQVDGVALEVLERDDLQRRGMGRPQHHPRRHARLQRLLPARGAQAPPIAGAQPRKAELLARGRQVVASRAGEIQELPRHAGAYGVTAEILIRLAMSIRLHTNVFLQENLA